MLDMPASPPAATEPGERSSGPLAGAIPGRLLSLDALRGFDMFWIVGAEDLVHALRRSSESAFTRLLANQLEHKAWEGMAFYDLIFPLFIFIVGVSLVFSLGRLIEREGRGAALKRVCRRAALLYLLGIFYYGGLATPFHEIRLLGVLQRIALCYFFAALVFCFCGLRGRVAICGGLLAVYWALMCFMPAPGMGAGDFAEGRNLANWIDREYLPWRKWDGDHDPEGLLSTLPAIATCLLGVFAGMLLQERSLSERRKVAYLAGAGVTLALLGWLWNLQFPVIKKVWTSSYVLVAGGYSCLLLAAFHQVIEVWKWQRWAHPFVWIGMNPITIYLVHNLVDMNRIARRFVGGDLNHLFGRSGELAMIAVVMAMTFGICYFLYRRRIFLRL
jgi:predicted acyltransferase